MPLPTPNPGEKQSEFMDRCMGSEMMMSEYPHNDQRVAVCMSQWGDSKRELISYSVFHVRSMNDEERIIEGIATTPQQARDGDILETSGIQFKLPIPFLYRHKEPFGQVISADVSNEGIKVRMQIPPAGVSAAIDEQWRLVKAGAVRGLSIAWRTLQETYDAAIKGFRILKSEWLELSAVPVPADVNATITSVRSADEAILAALGRKDGRSSTKTSGASDSKSKNGAKRMKTVNQKIEELETKRAPIETRMRELMESAETEDRKMTPEESTEYDGLSMQMDTINADLRRYRSYTRLVEVPSGASEDPIAAREARNPRAIRIDSNHEPAKIEDRIPKGNRMARYVIALVRAKGNAFTASQLAKEHYSDTPEVSMALRAAVEAGDTTTSTWASQLVPAAQQMASEFLDLLRPATIIGRVPGLRIVPFNIAVPLQTGGGTYKWVGEAVPKPVTSATFDTATLRWSKASGIIVITQELARFSSPSAETIIRNELVNGCARFLDGQFIDPSVAAVSNVSPASITNGISALAGLPSGSTAADFRADMADLLAAFINDNQDPSNLVILMSATTAMGLSLMVNALGQTEFPTLSMNGGTLFGRPVVVSETVADRIIVANASDLLVADDGGFSIDVSDQAAVQMSSTPVTGAESPAETPVIRSFWQDNLVGLRVERYITWKRARTSAVQWIDNVTYGIGSP